MLLRILQVLVFLLPIHGLISVFDIPYLRFWKELLLIGVGIIWFIAEIKSLLNKKSVQFKKMQVASLGFLVWLGLLVLISDDRGTALIAARYLGLGFGVYFLISRLQSLERIPSNALKTLSRFFISGTLVSLAFGVWAQFLGGYEVLQSLYSNTISSWVPGQVIPLYHETAGIIRMQGTSSGPVEFAHLLLLAVMVLPFTKISFKKQIFIVFLLVLGMALSLTRAVWLGAGIYCLFILFQKTNISFKKGLLALFLGTLVGGFILFTSPLKDVVIRSASTSEHITRPIEVFKIGLEHPVLGSLGKVGPAARTKNLALYNDDKAPIAENVFIDYFAQMGIVGLLLSLLFFGSFVLSDKKHLQVGIVICFVMILASIFDMTPLSISYFLFIALMTYSKTSSDSI